MNLLEHAAAQIKDFHLFGKSPTPTEAYAFGYADADFKAKVLEEKVKTVLEMQRRANEILFCHCVSNGVFNAWGRPMDCTDFNEANRAVENLLKSMSNPPTESTSGEPT